MPRVWKGRRSPPGLDKAVIEVGRFGIVGTSERDEADKPAADEGVLMEDEVGRDDEGVPAAEGTEVSAPAPARSQGFGGDGICNAWDFSRGSILCWHVTFVTVEQRGTIPLPVAAPFGSIASDSRGKMRDATPCINAYVSNIANTAAADHPGSVAALKQQLSQASSQQSQPPPLPQLDKKPKRGNRNLSGSVESLNIAPVAPGLNNDGNCESKAAETSSERLNAIPSSTSVGSLRERFQNTPERKVMAPPPPPAKRKHTVPLSVGGSVTSPTKVRTKSVSSSNPSLSATSPSAAATEQPLFASTATMSPTTESQTYKRPSDATSVQLTTDGVDLEASFNRSTSASAENLGSAQDLDAAGRSSSFENTSVHSSHAVPKTDVSIGPGTRQQGGRKSFNLWRHGSIASTHSGGISQPDSTISTTTAGHIRAGSVGTSLMNAFKEISSHVHQLRAHEGTISSSSLSGSPVHHAQSASTVVVGMNASTDKAFLVPATVESLQTALTSLQEDLGQLTFDHEKIVRALESERKARKTLEGVVERLVKVVEDLESRVSQSPIDLVG
ncbi:hypothetical protein HDU67_005530 [Dinochytrium kinnereticum]|nr:hypothetical protein HDU67_005530 [Dinochytrium kinnereticum]